MPIVLTSLQIDNYIDYLDRYRNRAFHLSEKNLGLLRDILRSLRTDVFREGEDIILWVCAQRCSFDEFCLCRREAEVYDPAEMRASYLAAYPDSLQWYRFCLQFASDGSLSSAWLDDCILYSAEWCGEDAVLLSFDIEPILLWLRLQAEQKVQMIRDGSYESHIREILPKRCRFGMILRRDYWEIYPQMKEAFLSRISQGEMKKFLEYSAGFDVPAEMREMTARTFYEAAAAGYAACEDLRKADFSRCRFKDTGKEHERYGGSTPKEIYYLFFDGDDRGLRDVPLDDPRAFARWLRMQPSGERPDRGGPWVLRRKISPAYGIFLRAEDVPGTDAVQLVLEGSACGVCADTVRMFVAMRSLGCPVVLADQKRIMDRFLGRDHIAILPYYLPPLCGGPGSPVGRASDVTRLDDEPRKAEVAGMAVWLDPILEKGFFQKGIY